MVMSSTACYWLASYDDLSSAWGKEAPASDVGADTFVLDDANDSSDASAIPASRYRDAVMADHPLVYLRLGDPKGSTSAHDEIGKFNGSYSNGGITFGTPGALAGDPDLAITFTDGTGKIDMPAAAVFDFDGTKAFSVELWLKSSTPDNPEFYVVDHATSGVSLAGWLLLLGGSNGGATFVRYANNTTTAQVTGTAPLVLEKWHHLVATYESATAFLYLDGALVGQTATSLALPVLGTTFAIGNANCACHVANAFRGDLDEVAIYDKALSAERITAHYDAARK
jgi:hypothetical protein